MIRERSYIAGNCRTHRKHDALDPASHIVEPQTVMPEMNVRGRQPRYRRVSLHVALKDLVRFGGTYEGFSDLRAVVVHSFWQRPGVHRIRRTARKFQIMQSSNRRNDASTGPAQQRPRQSAMGHVVNRDGIVCAVVFTGPNRRAQWLQRLISAGKSDTANASALQLRIVDWNIYAAAQRRIVVP